MFPPGHCSCSECTRKALRLCRQRRSVTGKGVLSDESRQYSQKVLGCLGHAVRGGPGPGGRYFFVVIHGTFGLDSTHNGMCYDPLVTALLIGGAAVAVCLVLLKKSGLAAALVVGEVALYARKTRKAAK